MYKLNTLLTTISSQAQIIGCLLVLFVHPAFRHRSAFLSSTKSAKALKKLKKTYMKLFKTTDIQVVEIYREQFDFVLPSLQLDRRRRNFDSSPVTAHLVKFVSVWCFVYCILLPSHGELKFLIYVSSFWEDYAALLTFLRRCDLCSRCATPNDVLPTTRVLLQQYYKQGNYRQQILPLVGAQPTIITCWFSSLSKIWLESMSYAIFLSFKNTNYMP